MTETGSQKSADAYRTISEVAAELKLPQHVLRFWETRFSQLKPLKRAGGRRFYRPEDIHLLRAVKTLLYGDGYTIKGVQRILREQGPRAVAALAASPQRGPSLRPAPQPTDPEIAPAVASAVPSSPVLADESVASAQADPPVSGDAAGRLRAVLRDLDDCARLLAVARAARR